MHLALDRGVPQEERDKVSRGSLTDLDAARTFLEVVLCFPTYACALGANLVPLEIELRRPVDIWLSYHPSCGRIPRVRHMIDWLIEAFNPAKFPWFKDEFVHPSEFKAVYMGEPLTHLSGDA